MPVLETANLSIEENEPNEVTVAPAGPVIGIIYPPPEVRNIVDKTASFVARNGPEFEARIRQNELGNPKFNFLNPGDPYHAYYQHKVKEFRDGKSLPVVIAPPVVPKVAAAAAARQQELLKAVTAEPEPPREAPPDFEFIADPPSISALDLDVVKLTAQFVARNGRQFLTDLMNREQRNYQFDFLRPQHSLFQYFTRLLEQYTKVLLPPKEASFILGIEARAGALSKARARAAWINHQAKRRAQDEARLERERAAYAAIDWHDFVVVETVDYPLGEPGAFPPPTTPMEVGARVLAQERAAAGGEEDVDEEDAEMQIESGGEEEEGLATMEDRTNARPDDNRVTDMEEDSSSSSDESDDDAPPPPPPPQISSMEPDPPLPPRLDKVVVKKYDPKRATATAANTTKDEWLVSPITGERIPASKVAEHMRIGLLDPRWLERRDRAAAERSDRDAVLAPGTAIDASLKQLAERRTDIFGVGDEETAIGKKIGEEEKRDERVTWDGHTSSVEAATRAARAHITLEDQIHQIHKVKGLLPDEEKEKIGPKPVPRPSSQQQQQQASTKTPAPPMIPPAISVPSAPPVPPTLPTVVPAPMIPAPMLPPAVLAPPSAVLAPAMIPPRPPLMGPPSFGFPTNPIPNMPIGGPMMGSSNDDEPAAKRARTEESLLSESFWLSRTGRGPITISVATPVGPDRSEWNLQGQILPFTMPLTSSVADLKTLITNITNMPAAKQKLHFDGLFFKDSNSLAFYNVSPGAVIQLQIKERGGRKK